MLEKGTYEVLRDRLLANGKALSARAEALNTKRIGIFGGMEMGLLGSDRIRTHNNCVPRDIVEVGNRLLFGYNVFIGLKTETQVRDVFSLHEFEEFRQVPDDAADNFLLRPMERYQISAIAKPASTAKVAMRTGGSRRAERPGRTTATTSSQRLPVECGIAARPARIPPSMDREQHRPLAAVRQPRRPNIQRQAILALTARPVVPLHAQRVIDSSRRQRLRRHTAPFHRVPHAGPSLRLGRRLDALSRLPRAAARRRCQRGRHL